MLEPVREASPRLKARTAGALYLLIFIAAPSGAATATAARMLITLACDTAVALIFYDLFQPVGRRLSLAALFFRLIFVAVMAVNSWNYLHAAFLKDARSQAAFNAGYKIAVVPFGIHCLLIGYLIFESDFLPRILGVMMAFAGVGWLTFLWPPLAESLQRYVLVCALLGEGGLTLWLLLAGVDAERWRHKDEAARRMRSMSSFAP